MITATDHDNGHSSNELREKINSGGLLVDNKLVQLICTGHFSIDELVYFSEMTGNLYQQALQQLENGLRSASSLEEKERCAYARRLFGSSQPFFDHFAARVGIYDLLDALEPENRKQWITAEEKMFEALGARLTLLELQGYETAKLAKATLVERREKYFYAEKDAKAFFAALARKYSGAAEI